MRDLELSFELHDGWPRSAWLAECVAGDPRVRVCHGRTVETAPAWFCEAVWDGEFDSGDFDATDLVFGSGGRARDGRVVFVSSGSTVDRLQCLRLPGRFMVSNSLACLLAVSGVKVVPGYERYPDLFRSVIEGIDSYERVLPTQSGEVSLCYFRNLAWDGRDLVEVDKPDPRRDFGSFATYRQFLAGAMSRIARNMKAGARRHVYDMISAVSSGYDSSAAAVLGREAGMRKAFSFRSARGGTDDHGAGVAEALGLELEMFDRLEWRRQSMPEVPYFAATGTGVDVIFSAARDLLQGHVLLTGFHGDKVWGKDTKHLGPNIVRGDASGLSFTEHRLELGCIHLPVPFMGVRQIRDIYSLSNSGELAAWDVPGEYSRPVPRRIIEEAGVRRGLFGTRKKAATSLFRQGEALLTEQTRASYERWLAQAIASGVLSASTFRAAIRSMLIGARREAQVVSTLMRWTAGMLPSKAAQRLLKINGRWQRWLNRRVNAIEYVFPWAIGEMSQKYRQ